MSRGGGGGSIASRFASWCGSVAVGAVVIGAILIAVVGPSSTGKLFGTAAVVGGQSTGMFFAALPQFFTSVKDGQDTVKPTGTVEKKSAKKAAPAADEN